MQHIEFIERLIAKGGAYQSGPYVVFDWLSGARLLNAKRYPDPPPVQYAILKGQMRSELDFPLWAPSGQPSDGHPSPWGNGNVTVNVAYVQSFMTTDW